MTSQDQPAAHPDRRGELTLGALLREQRETILREWEERVRQLPATRDLSRPVLRDHLPDLLEQLAQHTDRSGGDGREPFVAEAHARERLEVGFDVEDVIAEYGILREVVVRFATHAAIERLGESICDLNRAIDDVVLASVKRFAFERRRTYGALESISLASLASKDVTELFGRLLRVFLETTPAVDTATILLVSDGQLRVHATVGLEAELEGPFTLQLGQGFAGRIALERKPMFVRSASNDPLVLSPAIRAKGIRGLFGVPLVHEDELLGVAHMGSCSAYEFSEQDKRLFMALANRATVAIFHQRLRDALGQERQWLRALVEHLPAGVVMAEAPSGRFSVTNSRIADIWRQPIIPCESVDDYGKWRGFWPNGGRSVQPDEWALARAVRHGETVLDQEIQIVRGDGTLGAILNSAAPVKNDSGEVVGGVAAFIDISERKVAEEQLKTVLAQLSSERSRYRDLVDNMDHAVVWELDARSFELTFVSARALHLTGYDGEVWLREPGFFRQHVPPEDYAQLREMFERAVAEGVDARMEHAFRHANGMMIWLHTGVHPVRGEEGPQLHGVSVDITRLRRAIAARDEMLEVVSHDLRSPLSAITMGAAVLETLNVSDEARPRLERYLGAITRGATRMARLIDDLVDLASFDSGSISVRPLPEAPSRLVADAIAAIEAMALEKGLHIEVDVPESLPFVSADHERVLQVFSNLLGNAIKITPTGGRISISAVITPEDTPSHVQFCVADTGPGIGPEELVNIFERYWRSKTSQYRGRGLGLAIAKALVTAQQGQIWAESEPGRGAAFYFTLPLT